MMNRIVSFHVIAGLLATAFAANAQPSLEIHTKATAQEQLKASRAAIGAVGSIPSERVAERRNAVMNAIANLRAVEQTWPEDRAAVAEAYVLEGEMLVAATVRAYPTAEQRARAGLAIFENTPSGAILYRILGQSLQEQHRNAEAEQAFLHAEQHARLRELSAIDQLKIWQAGALFYDRAMHDPIASAKRSRAAAKIAGLPFMTYLSLAVQTLEHSGDSDRAAARGDLAELERLIAQSRQKNSSAPGDLAALRTYDAVAARYRKKLQ